LHRVHGDRAQETKDRASPAQQSTVFPSTVSTSKANKSDSGRIANSLLVSGVKPKASLPPHASHGSWPATMRIRRDLGFAVLNDSLGAARRKASPTCKEAPLKGQLAGRVAKQIGHPEDGGKEAHRYPAQMHPSPPPWGFNRARCQVGSRVRGLDGRRRIGISLSASWQAKGRAVARPSLAQDARRMRRAFARHPDRLTRAHNCQENGLRSCAPFSRYKVPLASARGGRGRSDPAPVCEGISGHLRTARHYQRLHTLIRRPLTRPAPSPACLREKGRAQWALPIAIKIYAR
jgi:hypothetical protein